MSRKEQLREKSTWNKKKKKKNPGGSSEGWRRGSLRLSPAVLPVPSGADGGHPRSWHVSLTEMVGLKPLQKQRGQEKEDQTPAVGVEGLDRDPALGSLRPCPPPPLTAFQDHWWRLLD